MSINLNLRARTVIEILGQDQDKKTLVLSGFYNVKIMNEGLLPARIYNGTLTLEPGIPVCLGVQDVAMLDDTKLEFVGTSSNPDDYRIKVIKYEVIDPTC